MAKLEICINTTEGSHFGLGIAIIGGHTVEHIFRKEQIGCYLNGFLRFPFDVDFISCETITGDSDWTDNLVLVEVCRAENIQGDSGTVDNVTIRVDSDQVVVCQEFVVLRVNFIGEKEIRNPNVFNFVVWKVLHSLLSGCELKTTIFPFLSEGQLDFHCVVDIIQRQDISDVHVNRYIGRLAWITNIYTRINILGLCEN